MEVEDQLFQWNNKNTSTSGLEDAERASRITRRGIFLNMVDEFNAARSCLNLLLFLSKSHGILSRNENRLHGSCLYAQVAETWYELDNQFL